MESDKVSSEWADADASPRHEPATSIAASRPSAAVAMPAFIRARSIVRLDLARTGGTTSVHQLYETGGLRIRFPRSFVDGAGHCEGVLINTGGGIAGGDSVEVDCKLGPRTAATLTTQSAERVYRADSVPAVLRITLDLAAKAKLAWLPQETILFNGARLQRHFTANMAPDATLTILEAVTFGRAASAEQLEHGGLHDQWRIRRDGRLVFAEAIRLDGAIAKLLDKPASGNGARAIATLLHIAPKAESRLAGLRRLLRHAKSDCAATAYHGMLVARFVSTDAANLRRDARTAAEFIVRGAMPRVWSC